MREIFRRAFAAADLPHFNPHSFRDMLAGTPCPTLPADNAEVSARLAELEQAGKDATLLIQAAQVLVRRDLR